MGEAHGRAVQGAEREAGAVHERDDLDFAAAQFRCRGRSRVSERVGMREEGGARSGGDAHHVRGVIGVAMRAEHCSDLGERAASALCEFSGRALRNPSIERDLHAIPAASGGDHRAVSVGSAGKNCDAQSLLQGRLNESYSRARMGRAARLALILLGLFAVFGAIHEPLHGDAAPCSPAALCGGGIAVAAAAAFVVALTLAPVTRSRESMRVVPRRHPAGLPYRGRAPPSR